MTDEADAARGAATLMRLATGAWISQALSAVAEINVADHLRNGPLTCGRLARATGANADALSRVMRALASVGVFARDDDDRFSLTAVGEHLRSDAPNSLRAYLIMLGAPEVWRAWGEILHSVRTGAPGFDHAFGAGLFDHLKANADAARIFDAAMSSRSKHENEAILAAYDFSGAAMIVDVAGGQGSLLAAILGKYAGACGVLFDLPHVIAAAQPVLAASGIGARCGIASGDFFNTSLPPADMYLLKRVIHDWDDERARAILSNCRRTIAPHGRLLLLELVIPPGDEPSPAKLLDLNMLILTGGRERTAQEYEALLASAGFRLSRVVTTPSAICVVEATPN